MPRRLAILPVAAVIVFAAIQPAIAIEMRAGPTARVTQAEVIDDDVYIASGRVAVDGRVRGDLTAAGGKVHMTGEVDGGVLAAGGSVEVTGRVGSTIRAAGGQVAIRGAVGRDIVAFGGTVEIAREARAGRDVAVSGGTVIIAGTVDRNVMIAGGRVEIDGTIAGNATIHASRIIIGPQAMIRGNLTYSSEQPAEIAQGARILGQVRQEPYPARPVPSPRLTRGLQIAFGIVDFFWMLILALFLVAVAPAPVQFAADVVRERTRSSAGWGLALLILIPITVLVLAVAIIGIPLAVILFLAQLLGLFVSHTTVALALGQRLFPRVGSRYSQVAIGVGIVAVATHLPYVGWLLRLAAVAVGLGAVALALWAYRRPPAPPARVMSAAAA